jgi:hypothetical protein
MYNGQVMQYSQATNLGAVQMGYSGVQLDRMLSDRAALYNVMAMNADGEPGLEVVGQVAVLVPADAMLDPNRSWDIEPLGVVEGNNAFGASIEVPEVRFWRYSDQRYAIAEEPISVPVDSDATKITHFKADKSELIRTFLGLTKMKADDIFWSTQTGYYKGDGHKIMWATADAAKNGNIIHFTWQYDLVDGSLLATNDEARTLESHRKHEH